MKRSNVDWFNASVKAVIVGLWGLFAAWGFPYITGGVTPAWVPTFFQAIGLGGVIGLLVINGVLIRKGF